MPEQEQAEKAKEEQREMQEEQKQDTPDVGKLQATLEETREALKRANAEAAERRIKLKELEEAEEKRRKAEMSDLEKLQTERDELQTQYAELAKRFDGLRLRQAFFDELAAQDCIFPDEQARRDAYELADLSGAIDDGEIDEKAITKAVKDLQKSRPYLFGKAEAPEDDGGKAGERKTPDDAYVESVKRRFGL